MIADIHLVGWHVRIILLGRFFGILAYGATPDREDHIRSFEWNSDWLWVLSVVRTASFSLLLGQH